MGTRGRKPKPPVVKEMEGNPGKRKLPEGYVKPKGAADMPKHITGYAETVWERVMLSMPAGVYTASDTEILAAYCIACAELRRAQSHLEIEGRVLHIETKQGVTVKRNPWSQIARESAASIATLGTRLGLDPTSRESIKAPDDKPKGKFGELVGIDGGKIG